jgi:hypothetical protein
MSLTQARGVTSSLENLPPWCPWKTSFRGKFGGMKSLSAAGVAIGSKIGDASPCEPRDRGLFHRQPKLASRFSARTLHS